MEQKNSYLKRDPHKVFKDSADKITEKNSYLESSTIKKEYTQFESGSKKEQNTHIRSERTTKSKSPIKTKPSSRNYSISHSNINNIELIEKPKYTALNTPEAEK